MDMPFETMLDELVARVLSGPMHFRLFLQPTMAFILGIRDGLHDARTGAHPIVWSILLGVGNRKHLLRSMLRRLVGPILVATIADSVVQYLMFGHVRPLFAFIVGTLLMATPYSIARGLSNRIETVRRSQTIQAAVRKEVERG